MSGFGPIGSFPIASIPGEESGYLPVRATLVFQGYRPQIIWALDAAHVAQFQREMVGVTLGGANVAGFPREHNLTFESPGWVSQFVREIQRGDGDVPVPRVGGFVRETLCVPRVKRRQMWIYNAGPAT